MPNFNIKNSLLAIYIGILLIANFAVKANPHSTDSTNHAHSAGSHEEKSEKYDPKSMVMHHIMDANQWNITSSIIIPLPIILYDKAEGKLLTTSSSVFQANNEEGNGIAEWEGFVMHHGRVAKASGETDFIDFSITKNVFTMIMAAIIMLIVFLSVSNSMKKNAGRAPKGLQNLIEPLIIFVRDEIAAPNLGHKTEKYLPYLLCVFFFIWINNLFGLIPIFPGGANVMGNISVTFTLSVFTLLIINLSGNKHYWQHIFWMPGTPVILRPIFAVIEVVGIISKPFALMIRLFANISAGHIIILSLVSLIFVFGKYNPMLNTSGSTGGAAAGAIIAVPFVMFISLIEILVAFLQAFIFTMLTSVFLGVAIEDTHHEEVHH